MNQPAPGITGAKFLLMAASAIIVIAGLKTARSLLLPFLVAMFLAMVSLPLLNWLQRRKVPKPLAVPITILMALSVLAGIVTLIGDTIRDFAAVAPRYQERLQAMTAAVVDWFRSHGIDLPHRVTTDLINPAQAIDLITGTLRGAAGVLSNVFLVLLIIIFFLFEAAGFPAKIEAAFGRHAASERFEKISSEVQRFLGIKSVISLATGGLVAAALAIIGVDFPLLWGMLAFLLNYIPTFGSILAAIPPVLLAIVQLGVGQAIAVGLVFLAVNLGLGNFLEPHLMGRRLGLSTLVVFLSLVFWGWVWGPVGMLLSVPLTMIIKILLENTQDLRWIAVLLGPAPDSDRTVR